MDGKEFFALIALLSIGAVLLTPIARALAKRIAGDVPRRQLEERDQEAQALREELATLRGEVAELAERVDFTERLLAKQDVPRLERPH